MEVQKYKVTKKVGPLKVGQIVTANTAYIRRKVKEGDCLEKVVSPSVEKKAVSGSPENK